MDANSTASDQDVQDWLIVSNPWVLAAFVLTHIGTLSVLIFFGKMMHKHAELAHPVFAVIFQEIIIMIICELSALGILAALVANLKSTVLVFLYSSCAFTAMQFHQVTWLIVTSLR